MNERTYHEEMSQMIAQVEQVHLELLEMRYTDERAVVEVRKECYLAYQKAYYASKIKNDAVKMRIRREKGRERRKSKSMKFKKVPLQGVSQGNEVELGPELEPDLMAGMEPKPLRSRSCRSTRALSILAVKD